MSLEQALAENTAAMGALTATLNAALKAGIVAAPAAPAAETPAKPAKAKAPAPAAAVAAATAKPTPAQNAAAAQMPVEKQVTQADIKKAGDDLTLLADHVDAEGQQIGRAAAVAILQEFGVQKMTAAPLPQIPAIHAKVKKKLVELGLAQEPAAAPSLV